MIILKYYWILVKNTLCPCKNSAKIRGIQLFTMILKNQ